MTTATKASPITRHYFGDASGVDLTTMPATFREDCARLVSLGARGVSFAPVGGDGLPLRGSRWVSGPVGSTYYRIDFAALAKARPEAVQAILSVTDDRRPICPVCDAHGIETVTSADETAMIEVDAGLTEPLRGVPCEECASQEAA